MEVISFLGVSFGGECNLFHHGVVQDCLQRSDFEFSAGNLYGIIGEFGEGGAALSCGITGNTDYYEGKIYVDGIEKSCSEVADISWYVGTDLYKCRTKGLFRNRAKINKRTIKEQIEYGVSCQQSKIASETILEMFGVSPERAVRNINYVSGERLKASAAIGFANGKKIYCYPWMNSNDIERLREQISQTVKVLTNAGCIVIIPTTKADNIKKILDISNVVNL